jgi:hypothetical protein
MPWLEEALASCAAQDYPGEIEVVIRPGGNPGANEWFLQSTPIEMPPQRGDICGRWT